MGNFHHGTQRGEARFVHQTAAVGSAMKALMEQSYEGRIFDPLSDVAAAEKLKAQRDRWETEGRTIAFTSGVFDMLHLNHTVYMNSIRIAAVHQRYQRQEAERAGRSWEELSEAQQREYIGEMATSRLVKLIVSVDGDMAVAHRKGFQPTKGNVPRPFYGWDTRIREVLNLCTVVNGQPQLIADAVTMHDNQHPRLVGTPNAGIMEIGAYVRPDVWGVFHESQDIIDALATDTAGRYDDITPVILHHEGLYTDRLLGGPPSTTAIVERIGAAMMEGIAHHNGATRIA